MNKKQCNFIVIIFMVFINLSCSKKSVLNENTIFRYNEHSNISSLDPAFSNTLRNIWPVNQIFNGLVQLDDSLNIKPDLAKSWKISNDGIKYSFLIKKIFFFINQKFLELIRPEQLMPTTLSIV